MTFEILEQFRKAGNSASYHYADDSTREWHLARREEDKAMELFYANPDLERVLRRIAKGFLWSLDIRLENDKRKQSNELRRV